MAKVLEELLVKLGYELSTTDKQNLQDFVKGSMTAAKALTAIAASAAAAATALTAFTKSMSDQVATQGLQAETMGEAVELVSAFEFAAKQATGSADGLSEALFGLMRRMSRARIYGDGELAATFARLGIEAHNSRGELLKVDELIFKIGDALLLKAPAEQLELAQKLGLQDFILLLRQGGDGMRELLWMAQELGVVTQEDAIVANRLRLAWNMMSQVFNRLKVDVMKGLAPILEKIVGMLTRFYLENKESVQRRLVGFFKTLAEILGSLFVTTFKISMAIIDFADRFVGLNALLRIFLILLTGISFLLAGASIKAALAAIPAFLSSTVGLLIILALILEDIWVSLKGGKGVLASLGETLDEMTNGTLSDFIAGILTNVEDIWKYVEKIINGINKLTGGDIKGGFKESALGAAEMLKTSASLALKATPVGGYMELAGVSNIFNINVTGATSPEQTAMAVSGAAPALGEAVNNLSSRKKR